MGFKVKSFIFKHKIWKRMAQQLEIKSPLEIFYQWETEKANEIFMRQPINGKWQNYTWKQCGSEVRSMAAYLKSLNYEPGSRIAILSKNCVHWILSDLAIWMAGHVSVPLYPNITPATLKQILEHSESKLVFVGKLDDWAYLKPGVPAHLPCIAYPFYGISEFANWDDIIAKQIPLSENQVYPIENLATIMYTSGTTGIPKGVMHTFYNFAFAVTYALPEIGVRDNARFFSYLPMCHIAERLLIEMGCLYSGGTVAFAESLETFPKNLAETKPTVFLAVPRIWAKFQEKILQKIPQKKLNMLLKIPLISGMVKRKIKASLGLTEATNIFSGAAPISVDLINWFGKLGIQIQQAYAMTEDSCYSHVNVKNRDRTGTVGQNLPYVDVRISEEGEIQIKHPALMKGYFKEPQLSAEAFTPDGYFKTGDKGERDAQGYLKITGRVKDLFKTGKGKYVAPGPIEMRLMDDADIEQACVVGVGLPQPIALLVLSEQGKKKAERDLEHGIRQVIYRINNTLDSFEKLHKAIIVKDEWTVDNGFMTPTLKIKRNEVEKKYADKYESWYAVPEDVIWEHRN
ncbi:MAG: AMP-binding protein [Chitinophagales bacterium]